MVAQATLRLDANAIGFIDEWTLAAGASKVAAVQTDDDATSYIDANSASDVEQAFTIDTTFPEKMAWIISVEVKGKCRADASTVISNRFDVRINSTDTNGSTFTADTTWTDFASGSLARPGGGDWTEDDLRLTGSNAFNFSVFHPSQANDLWCTELYAEITYIPLNRTIDLEREIASRRLRLNREPEQTNTVIGGWGHLEAELMDLVHISNAQGPTYDGAGWGLLDWERAFGVLKRQRISLSVPRVASTVGDRRRYMTTFWETMKLTVSGDPDIADGLARLDAAGADRQFSRDSKAWVEDVGGVIQEINEAKEKIEPNGILIEGGATNFVVESSFVNGTTGWTKTENTGTADFATDTSDLLFDSGVSAQSVSLTATAATHNVDISDVTASLSASTVYTISVDSKMSNAETVYFALQNDTTTNWLQSNGTWGASRAEISLSTTAGSKERNAVTFTTEGTASTHTVHVGGSGTTNGSKYNFYHVQIENVPWQSSRVVTTGASVTAAKDFLQIDNSSTLAQGLVNYNSFTCKIIFRPQWDLTDIASDRHIFTIDDDGGTYFRVYSALSVANDPLRFELHDGMSTYIAFINNPSMSKGTEHTIVVRKVGTQGEFGLTSDTLSIFLDGTKGTDVVSADIAFTGGTLTIGSLEDNTNLAWGHFGEIMISPVVYSDEEIAGGI